MKMPVLAELGEEDCRKDFPWQSRAGIFYWMAVAECYFSLLSAFFTSFKAVTQSVSRLNGVM